MTRLGNRVGTGTLGILNCQDRGCVRSSSRSSPKAEGVGQLKEQPLAPTLASKLGDVPHVSGVDLVAREPVAMVPIHRITPTRFWSLSRRHQAYPREA